MDHEVVQLADYGYECARDIARICTALAVFVLPIAFLIHSLIAYRKQMPLYMPEIKKTGAATAATFLNSHMPRLAVLTVIYFAWNYLTLGDLPLKYPWILSDEFSNLHSFIYPLFSFAWLWTLSQELAPSAVQQWRSKQGSIFVTAFWVTLSLVGAKGLAYSLGILAFIYVAYAIRGDLSLALIMTRGANPFTAYWQSFRISTKRFTQFSWMFSKTACIAWLTFTVFNIPRLAVYYMPANDDHFNISPYIMISIFTIIETACAALLTYFDSLIMVRGIKLLEEIEKEEGMESTC